MSCRKNARHESSLRAIFSSVSVVQYVQRRNTLVVCEAMCTSNYAQKQPPRGIEFDTSHIKHRRSPSSAKRSFFESSAAGEVVVSERASNGWRETCGSIIDLCVLA